MRKSFKKMLLVIALVSSAANAGGKEATTVFLKCSGERSSETITDGVVTSDPAKESWSELKVDGSSIYMLGLDGEYFDLALPVGHRLVEHRVLGRTYTVGARFVRLDSTVGLYLPHEQTTRTEIVIDRHSGTYSVTETIDNTKSTRRPWFMRILEVGTCEPFDPSRRKF